MSSTMFIQTFLLISLLSLFNAQYIRYLTTSNPSLRSPYGIAVDAQSNIIVADGLNHRIVKLSLFGEQLAVFNETNPSLESPFDVVIDTEGNIYVSEYSSSVIIKLAPNGTQLDVFTTAQPAFNGTMGLAIDQHNNLYVTDIRNFRVVKLSPNGTLLATFTTQNPSLDTPTAVAVDGDGYVYIADTLNNRIVKLDQNNTQEMMIDSDVPTGIALDANGTMYVTTLEQPTNPVIQYSSNGTILAKFETPTAMVPFSVALDTMNNVYCTDVFNSRIIVFMRGSISSSSTASLVSSSSLSIISSSSNALSSSSGLPSGTLDNSTDIIWILVGILVGAFIITLLLVIARFAYDRYRNNQAADKIQISGTTVTANRYTQMNDA